jgi:hypothetical protein
MMAPNGLRSVGMKLPDPEVLWWEASGARCPPALAMLVVALPWGSDHSAVSRNYGDQCRPGLARAGIVEVDRVPGPARRETPSALPLIGGRGSC